MVLILLTTETRNEVGRERNPGNAPAKKGNCFQVLVNAVAAVHPMQHTGGTGLDRQMNMVADVRTVGYGVNKIGRNIFGMRSRKADPASGSLPADGTKQGGKVSPPSGSAYEFTF